MKVVSTEWLDFKKRVIEMAQIFEKDENFLKLEYDFTFCATRIKRLSFSKSYETIRFEMAIKDNRNG